LLLPIEKLVYGGDGLARLPPDARGSGKAVFLPFVLSGEKVEAELTEQKTGFARARVQQIVEASPHRVTAPCQYFERCGGCHYQHAAYEHQLEIKGEILRENLRRIAKIDLQSGIRTHPSPPWNYRNRSRLQVRSRPRFSAGYFKFASHELLPVEQCPISSPLVNRGIAALWHSGRAGKAAEGVREAEFFAAPLVRNDGDLRSDGSEKEDRLLLEFLCAPEARRAAVRAWAEELMAEVPEIAGVTAFREPQKGMQELMVAVGASSLTCQTRRAVYRVSAGAFFQTNRFLTDELVDIVTTGASGDVAVDLYAGVGLFSTALACDIRHVVSVEMSQTSFDDLKYNLPLNGKAVHAETEQYLAALGDRGGAGQARTSQARVSDEAAFPQPTRPPDLVVVDPPRAGLGDGVARLLAGVGAPRITYVSCDPATLARDLVPLLSAGYRLEEVHLVDLFPQTYHLESVVKLIR
jgi:23S rRNA (uracil1939-C5)-methyltransferase